MVDRSETRTVAELGIEWTSRTFLIVAVATYHICTQGVDELHELTKVSYMISSVCDLKLSSTSNDLGGTSTAHGIDY